jgi:hypothetical protein
MRAISVAKSIDDISNSMAETLFGDADLAKLSSALETSGWTPDEAASAAPVAASPSATPSSAPSPGTAPSAAMKVPPQPAAAKPPPPMPAARPPQPMSAAKPAPPPADDDPFDFLGLGHDAPLELIDEPVAPQQRKEAGRNR